MGSNNALYRFNAHVLLVVFCFLPALWPTATDAQAPQLIVTAGPWVARGAAIIRTFLASYAAGKGVDFLLGSGAAVRDSLSRLHNELQVQATAAAADRQLLLRQVAILDGLRSDLSIVMARRPAATEAAHIERRTQAAIDQLESVQADHDRRIGRLERGQDSLRRLFASLAGTAGAPGNSPVPPQRVTCTDANTGHFEFKNSKAKSGVYVRLYFRERYREWSDSNLVLLAPAGQTQIVYDFPAGPHGYVVTSLDEAVIFLQGQLYVEQCKTGRLEIK